MDLQFKRDSPESIKYTPMRWDETNIILVSVKPKKIEAMTVKQFVMLLTSQSISAAMWSAKSEEEKRRAYKRATPIARIYCTDGESLSVQCHGGVHCAFEGVPQDELHYSTSFGKELIMVETDCENLRQYGIDSIDDVEKYVASHGGIDIEKTVEKSVDSTINAINKTL